MTVNHTKEAANAQTALYVMAAVEGLLECGTVEGGREGAQSSASKIIKICRNEMQRQLKRYDFHVAEASKVKP